MEPIQWLASWPKSGNTWVRMFLFAYNCGSTNINNNLDLTVLDTQLYAHRVVSPKCLEDMHPSEIVHLRHAALMHLIVRHPVNPVVLKTHNANIIAGSVEVIPDSMSSDSVYLIRDPRDVAVSYSEHMGHTYDETVEVFNSLHSCLDNGGTGLYHYLTTWPNHVISWVDKATFSVQPIRYEDLLTNPVENFEAILKQYGITPIREKVERAIEVTKFDELKKQEDEKGFVEASAKDERFFKRGYSGYWPDYLTEEQAKQIEEICGEVMDRFGYERHFT